MSSAEFGWDSLLHTDAPLGCSLKAALFTTYDRADERLLAEHLLPLLLKLGHEPDGEGRERQYFLVELAQRLERLHDRLVVVSSTVREEPTDSAECASGTYGWIWRSIRQLTVGHHRKAVQHAKLWLLHWGAADANGIEYLEIVVSSANLTRAAFRDQLQAAWRACIELRPQRSEARLTRWGVLPHFLRELAASAGGDAHLAPFVELLARADCPKGVTFVASVPGTHSRQLLRRTPWGAAGLRKITPAGRGTVRVAILSPFVGSWNADALSRWCVSFEGSPDRIDLVWIDKDHPWARDERWLLPTATLKTLTGAGASLLHLCHEPDGYEETDIFHEEHRPADTRWSHAKVYSFKRGTSRRLLVTSANFSTSAWGSESRDGELTIANFELGVCVEQAAWQRFEDLEAFEDENNAATVSELSSRSEGFIPWAQAVWDGKQVYVDCRCKAKGDIDGKINSGGEWTTITDWTVGTDDRLRSAQVSWVDAKRPPSLVQLTYEQETLSVAVFDERPMAERENCIPPEVDENAAQTMRDELLFEQYGGRIAADDGGEGSIDSDNEPDAEYESAGAGRPDSYAVPAFVLARRHLGVVDNWASQVKRSATRGTAEFEREVLRRDGELLIEAFKRQADRDDKKGAIGAKLAAEELTLRLKHFEET
jgi:hypothetical protein